MPDFAEWKVPEGMDYTAFERKARTLAHREHKKACEGSHDHDCGDWLTYSEQERHEARRKVTEQLGEKQS